MFLKKKYQAKYVVPWCFASLADVYFIYIERSVVLNFKIRGIQNEFRYLTSANMCCEKANVLNIGCMLLKIKY